MSNTITDILKPELPEIKALMTLNKNLNVDALAIQELNYLEQQTLTKPDILVCIPQTIILAVKSVIRKNLTLDPSAGLVYIKTRNVKIGNQWLKALEIQETANGLISYNRQFGRILDYINQKVIKDSSGKVIGVLMSILKPSYPNPRWEDYDYDESDFRRWATYSHKENSKYYKPNEGKPQPDDQTLNYANKLYFSWQKGIDPEFARAKCIRHSLKRLGTNTNELMQIRPIKLDDQLPIDATIAAAEADDFGDFTSHEELNTTINETPTNHENSKTTQEHDFNSNDL